MTQWSEAELDLLFDAIRRREGDRYTDDPGDPGGATRYGITLKALRAVRGAQMTAQDVAALTWPEARAIYEDRYLRAPGFDQIADFALMCAVVDCGVNCGTRTAGRLLQHAAEGLEVDGIVGPATLQRVNGSDPARLKARFVGYWVLHYAGLIDRDLKVRAGAWPALKAAASRALVKFLLGWMRRATEHLFT